MALVRNCEATPRLAILDSLPAGFLNCRANDLHTMFDGPTLIELSGAREPPLFVSILLHGNEDSGLGAVQRVFERYHSQTLPRSLMLLIGNVAAARSGLRRLDGQADYNRNWPGAPDPDAHGETRIMAEVHARVVASGAIAAIDLHNNSGRNPHYAVVCSLDSRTLGLAALFCRRVVLFRGVPGTQTASFAGLIPAITAECGLAGEADNAEAAARLVDAALNLDELPDGVGVGAPLELYHTLGVVRVREDVSFSFDAEPEDVRFDPALDERNFRELSAGTVLGETDHLMPLRMIAEDGSDVANDYFETAGGQLRLRKHAVPAMLTSDSRIVRQDCLCYLMERL